MVVVSDTSAISNLQQIGQLDLLRRVFGTILIPPAVEQELCAVAEQKSLLATLSWIQVVSPQNQQLIQTLGTELDWGESEAIALALEQQADFLIIDEFSGRQIATKYGIQVVGILGILVQAKQKGLIQAVRPLAMALRQNGFRLRQTLLEKVLQKLGE